LPPLGALVALLGLPRYSPRRIALALALLVVATVLAIVALVELAHALRLALLSILHPAWVALILGAALLLLAALLGLVALRLSRPLPPPPRPAPAAGASPGESDLLALAIAWVRAHPHQATVLAAVLGFLTGALPEARRALADILGPPR
jgi:hypothetical protein